jgi:two-component system CheB/CheR fusion protein
MYGWSEAEALGMNSMETVPESKRTEVDSFMQRLRAGEPIDSFATQRKTKDGRILDVGMTVTRLVDEAKRMTAIATTERDLTERKSQRESGSRKEETSP